MSFIFLCSAESWFLTLPLEGDMEVMVLLLECENWKLLWDLSIPSPSVTEACWGLRRKGLSPDHRANQGPGFPSSLSQSLAGIGERGIRRAAGGPLPSPVLLFLSPQGHWGGTKTRPDSVSVQAFLFCTWMEKSIFFFLHERREDRLKWSRLGKKLG